MTWNKSFRITPDQTLREAAALVDQSSLTPEYVAQFEAGLTVAEGFIGTAMYPDRDIAVNMWGHVESREHGDSHLLSVSTSIELPISEPEVTPVATPESEPTADETTTTTEPDTVA